jgi:ankyrin repeat protein
MLANLLRSNVDILSSVIQHLDDLNCLYSLSGVSRSLNQMVNDSIPGRQAWLNVGISITAGEIHFDAESIRLRFAPIQTRGEFFWSLRLLVCPWHAVAEMLPVKVGGFQRHLISLVGDRIVYQKEDGDSMTSFPARPCDGFDGKIVRTEAWVDPTIVSHDQHAALVTLVNDKRVVPDFSHDRSCTYQFFPVHAGVYGVVETFSRSFDNGISHNDGVYFFSHKDGGMLRHFRTKLIEPRNSCCVLSRPMELWLLTTCGVEYFGPSCSARLDAVEEKMDPALWMAGQGDAAGAIEFMQDLGAPLYTPSLISERNLLHYAAKEGHIAAVQLLLASEFEDIDAADDFGHTALHLAVAELHLDVVEELVNVGNAAPFGGVGSALSDIGSHVQYRPYSTDDARVRDEIARIVPAIVSSLIQKDLGVIDHQVDLISEPSILSSPDAVRMLCAKGAETLCCDVAFTFGSFRCRAQELSAIRSLGVLVREFGLDINGSTHEVPAVLTLARNGIAEAVIMVIDNLGADPSVLDKDGKGIRELAEIRSRQLNDTDGRRILSFLDSRGL